MRQAYEAFEEIEEDSLRAITLALIALNESKSGNRAKAIDTLDQALTYEKNGGPDYYLVNVNAVIAASQAQIGQMESALSTIDQLAVLAVKLESKFPGAANQRSLVVAINSIFRAQIDSGDCEGAKNNIREAIVHVNSIAEPELRVTLLVHVLLLSLKLGEFDSADEAIRQALEDAENIQYGLRRATTLAFISEWQENSGNAKESRAYFAESEELVSYIIDQLRAVQYVDHTAHIFARCASTLAQIGLSRANSGDLAAATKTFVFALQVTEFVDPLNTMSFHIMEIEHPDPMILTERLQALAEIGQA